MNLSFYELSREGFLVKHARLFPSSPSLSPSLSLSLSHYLRASYQYVEHVLSFVSETLIKSAGI